MSEGNGKSDIQVPEQGTMVQIAISFTADGRLQLAHNCPSDIVFYGLMKLAEKAFDANQQKQVSPGIIVPAGVRIPRG